MSAKFYIVPVATLTALLIASQHGIALAATEALTIKADSDEKADLHAKLDAATAADATDKLTIASLQDQIIDLKTEGGEPIDPDVQTAIDAVVAADPAATPPLVVAPEPTPDVKPDETQTQPPSEGDTAGQPPAGSSGVSMSSDS